MTELSRKGRIDLTISKQPKTWILNLVITLGILIALFYSFNDSKINWVRIGNLGESFTRMINGFLNPDTDFLFGQGIFDFDEGVIYLSIETLAIAYVGTLIGGLLAIPVGVLASKNITGKFSKIAEVVLILIRTFPEILLALMLVKSVGLGPLAGALTIGIHSVGMMGKLVSESIENMDKGPIEALDAVGAGIWAKLRYAVLPQVMADFISIGLYRFDINVRSASVLGLVSAGGIGAMLIFTSQEQNWGGLSAIMIAVIIMVLAVEIISSKLREKLV
jgi:phosphonate transport system permease protein